MTFGTDDLNAAIFSSERGT